MPTVALYNVNGEQVGEIALNDDIFGIPLNESVLHDVAVAQLANRRRGTHDTKTRAEVSGGGKKPWRQKGTGRARVGSIRNPIWRGGGVVFGPHPRDYSYRLPQRTLINATRSALNAKLRDNRFLVVEEMKIGEAKTKKMKQILDKFKIQGRLLLVLDKPGEDVKRASRNLEAVRLIRPDEVTSDDVLRCGHIMFTKNSLEKITKRLA